MLVLTTMFINVSNNLPKTSYVKMVDIWLIFNLLLPLLEVLIHTLRFASRTTIVAARSEDDREINHHDHPVEVGDKEEEVGISQFSFCNRLQKNALIVLIPVTL